MGDPLIGGIPFFVGKPWGLSISSFYPSVFGFYPSLLDLYPSLFTFYPPLRGKPKKKNLARLLLLGFFI